VSAYLTQVQNNNDNQAAATAEVMRARAQETLDAAYATLQSAQTQDQFDANVIAAQVAATAEIVRANAQATLVAAGSTQGAAQTQDAFRQTQVQNNMQMTANQATQNTIATVTQQNSNFIASGTQTSVANTIATQTQSAVATTQWYSDQARQRDEQRQAPLTFLWLWCPPLFIVAMGLICLLFFWRWMKIRENQQLIDMQPVEPPVIIDHQPRPVIAPEKIPYPITKSPDHVDRWMDEVKDKLTEDDKEDDDNTGK
jgi:lipopolysaccharide export LptBFGC system permease protein LptF